MGAERRKLIYFISEDWYFWSHRLPIARAARDAGFEVVLMCRVGKLRAQIEAEGIRLIDLPIRRGRMSPLGDLRLLLQLIGIYRRERPDVVHHVAMKPVIWGALAARIAGVPKVINALAGLGFVFTSETPKTRLLRPLLRTLLHLTLDTPRSLLILQNDDDVNLFVRLGLVPRERIRLIRGSGVDTDRFRPAPEPEGTPVVILPARMLWDKGVGEFVEAARILKRRGVQVRMALVGDTDEENPAAVPRSQLEDWRNGGVVEWWGHQDDMPAVFARCSVVCLPSYREGLSKALLEAAACGRPIVTTDAPGCRDLVIDGCNGVIVPCRDSDSIASALGSVLANFPKRADMGISSRKLVEENFGVAQVASQALVLYAHQRDHADTR